MCKAVRDIGTCISLVALVVFAGCNPVPVSVHPLSDAQSSVPDEGLIGYWRQVDPDQSANMEPEAVPLVIGRGPGETRSLEVVGLDLDTSKRVRVRRTQFWTTPVATLQAKPGEASRLWHVMSLRLRDLEPEKRPEGYWLLLYEHLDPGRVRFYRINPVVVAAAIESGQLTGHVRRNPRAGKPMESFPNLVEPEFDAIRITAKPVALRTYLAMAGKTCFDREKPILELQSISSAVPAATRPEKLPAQTCAETGFRRLRGDRGTRWGVTVGWAASCWFTAYGTMEADAGYKLR